MEQPRARSIVRPRVELLPPELAGAARECAEVLTRDGHQAWIVGGAVRDLALGRRPKDIDLTTDAVPDELERLFPRAHAVGRAFGTVVVHTQAGLDVEVTTFRRDGVYADGRRPDSVEFGTDLGLDAERRDFTCNALYLDPLADRCEDPTGGLADLAAGCLRCVGEPERRFAEDGLRLLRLVRLAAELELCPEPATRAAAAASGAALRGVSPERVLAECARLASGPAPGGALRELVALGLATRLPGFARLPVDELAERAEAVSRAGRGTLELLLATFFRPGPGELCARRAALEELRPARALLSRVVRAWELVPEIEAFLAVPSPAGRARRIRLLRDEAFPLAAAVVEAWHGAPVAAVLRAAAAELGPAGLFPVLFVTSHELATAGVARGPRFGALLRAAEEAQLDGRITNRAEAEAWLATELARATDGLR